MVEGPQRIASGGLLERGAELDTFAQAIDAAAAGRGSSAMVVGPAGIGKTRLLEEARSAAAGAGLSVLDARARQLEREFAFGVARQLFEPALAELPGDDRTRLLEGVAAPAASLFPVFSDAKQEAGARAERRFEVLHALHTLTAELARRGPLLITVDDAHWADPPSLRFLSFLARRIEPQSALLVVAARPTPEWEEPQLLGALEAERSLPLILPRALSDEGALDLIEADIGRSVDPAFARGCRELTGGNPFYLHSLTAEILEQRIEPSLEGVGALERLGPDAVQRSLLERLAAGGSSQLAVAHASAILGNEAPPVALAELGGIDHLEAAQATDELRRLGIFDRRAGEGFAHPILRSAVYEAIPPARRALLHARAAALLREHLADPDAVAAQILAAEPGAVDGAASSLRLAATDAGGRGAPEVAATYLARALAEPLDPSERASLLLELGTSEALSRGPQATTHLREAIAQSTDDDEVLMASLALWNVLSSDGRIEQGLESLRAASERGNEASSSLALRIDLELARAARSCRPTVAEGRRRIAELPTRVGNEGELGRLAHGLVAYDSMLANRPVAEVVGQAERVLPLHDEILERSGSQLAHLPIYTLIYCDQIQHAIELCDGVITRGRRRGSVITVGQGLLWRSFASLRAGALRDAIRDAGAALAAANDHGWRFGQASARLTLTEAALERGDLAGAEALQTEMHAAVESEQEVKGWMDHMRHTRALWRLVAGDERLALRELLEIGRLHDEWLVSCPSELPWRSNAALAALACGEREVAIALAVEEVKLARAFGAPRALGVALRVNGLVIAGAEGLEFLREAVAVLAGSPARLEHARALTDFGAALLASERPREARVPLRAGLDEASLCEATALADRARAELLASGARPRTEAGAEGQALTAAERRVALLAAQGATNPEVAETLSVSRKTVEAHLSSAYRKLGIASRMELAGAITGQADSS